MEPKNHTRIICLRSDAFYALVDQVVDYIDRTHNQTKENEWIGADDAMRLLGITSRTTLQKLRDEGKIRFSQASKKLLLFDRKSILEYIEQNAKNTF